MNLKLALAATLISVGLGVTGLVVAATTPPYPSDNCSDVVAPCDTEEPSD